MEEYIIYAIGFLALAFILKKIFTKDGSCGCGGKGSCSKK
ncbi:FeoB-associated Cys-rich membrane protein [Poseidonibacter antarcticus]|nr:FeoB-associated Cys-rich membrane protein [Poseidonibacter antarcticus]